MESWGATLEQPTWLLSFPHVRCCPLGKKSEAVRVAARGPKKILCHACGDMLNLGNNPETCVMKKFKRNSVSNVFDSSVSAPRLLGPLSHPGRTCINVSGTPKIASRGGKRVDQLRLQ